MHQRLPTTNPPRSSERASALRARFFLSYMLAWWIGGGLLAVAFSSAGPVYYDELGLTPNPYTGLFAYLNAYCMHWVSLRVLRDFVNDAIKPIDGTIQRRTKALETAIAEGGRSQRRERDEICGRAGIDENRIGKAEIGGEFALELLGGSVFVLHNKGERRVRRHFELRRSEG